MHWYALRPAEPATTAALLTVLRPRATAVHLTVRGDLPPELRPARPARPSSGPLRRLLARFEPDGHSGPARHRTALRTDDDATWDALLRHLPRTPVEVEVVAAHRLIARAAVDATPVAELTDAERDALARRAPEISLEPLPAPPAWYRVGRG